MRGEMLVVKLGAEEALINTTSLMPGALGVTVRYLS
jgi:hypothetical protein